MPIKSIPYKETGYFSKLICDYLAEEKSLIPFYNRFPNLENFKLQIEEKQNSFNIRQRRLLSKQIMLQYGYNSISQATLTNLDLLKENTTFTVTTGHQLNLFTGPLYFLYKIYSTINLCEKLKEHYPNFNFVPVYWMATEDHDFEEINYFNTYKDNNTSRLEKVKWDRNSSGAVGGLNTEGLNKVFEKLKTQFGNSENAKELLKYFSDAYLKNDNLADATRHLANTLFFESGLVIVDGNDEVLKKHFIPYAEKEINENLSFKKVSETTKKLTDLGHSEQVHPREINLFYLNENIRERIIESEGDFYVNNTEISFSKEEILAEINDNPQCFSPNALLRPLYQEAVLPNLCYIGGGGELAYWFQLKDYFNEVKVPFPILLLRNSALITPKKLLEELETYDVSVKDLFLPQQELITKHVHKISDIEIDFSKQREFLKQQFKDLYVLAEKTDKSFLGAVAAQEKKQLNGLDKLESRLLKAQKRKLSEKLNPVKNIQDTLFPKGSLQERNLNFSNFYLDNGEEILDIIKENLDPLNLSFTIIEV